MNEPPDDLDELLRPRPPAVSSALRDDLLHRTQQRLARDRWLRRGASAALVAGVFTAGGLAGWMARPPVAHAPGSRQPVIEVVSVPLVLPIIQPQARDTPDSPKPPGTASSAELQAEQEDDPHAAAKLYRQAGDRFLRDQDYPNATRCYRLYLARAGDDGLALDSNDSWLLVSLKNAAYKEKVDATKNDS